ncbi:MAG: YbaB/EbfC family nucleoid-associated protein [Deferribacteres bacterium]|nr:YbaB/EbfC family nucleoid-associated protein [candidate division KSB1 bacterium]MCB9511778.1 YbaB/EbfC family nucleoid-associated protein [Deferribacteres bacterium]
MSKLNMGNLLKQAQQMQSKLQKIQDELAEKTVEGSAGGGMVTAIANGKNEVVRIKIDKEVVDPEDVEILEDLVVAAVNQALKNAQEMASSEMAKATGGMMQNLPGGLNFPGM